MHTIHLLAVDSRYATKDEIKEARITDNYYPANWRLMAHQAKTVQALNSDADIVINTAMTGDGKSLAGQLLLFNNTDWHTLTLYPTNELALDQQRGLKKLLEDFDSPPVWRPYGFEHAVMNAAELDTLQDHYERSGLNVSRPDAVKRLLGSNYLLSNPDIFHLCVSFAYRNYGSARDITLGTLASHYRLFTFDEFHLFGTPETASVMTALLLLRQMKSTDKQPRFLFLSATPQEQLKHMAAQVGLKVETVNGDYVHGADVPPEGYRRILRPIDLTLYAGRLDDWVQAHWQDVILRFYQQHAASGARGVLIANSVATAHQVHAFLRGVLPPHIRLGKNTGLTPKADRAMDCDLLVGTSTIDVGVDFKINLLIFESVDAASHMQRLGRLGRHAASSDGRVFEGFEAHAMMPPWVVEGIRSEIPEHAQCDRPTYHQLVTRFFQKTQTFERYIQRWAGVQAGQILDHLKNGKEIRAQYEHILMLLKDQYYALFQNSLKKFWALHDKQRLVIRSASTFRSDSPLTVLVCDQTENQGKKAYIPYNALTLLRNADLFYQSWQEAEKEYVRIQQKQPSRDALPSWDALQRSEPLAAFLLRGWLPKERRRRVGLKLEHQPEEDQRERVIELSGFRFDVLGGFDGALRVNDTLYARTLVCFLIPDRAPDDVRRICKLGMQTELLRVSVLGLGDTPWTAAFGRDALLLDSVWRRQRSDADKPLIY